MDNFSRTIQLISVVCLNLVTIMYLVDHQKFFDIKMDHIEFLNEFGNLSISIVMLTMTAINDGVRLAKWGLLINYSILLLFSINCIFVVSTIFKASYRKCKHREVIKKKKELEQKRALMEKYKS